MRNSLTQTILKTIDLTDVGNGRFESTYLVPPADGLYFDITTKVYSDAGYTTQDTIYSDENNQYLGAIRWSLQYWNAGNGGADIDYKRIKKIVEDEVSKIKSLSSDDVSAIVSSASSAIKTAIEETHKAVTDIVIPEVKIPEPEKLDVTPVLSAVRELVPMLQEIDRKGGEVLTEEQNLMNAIGASAEAVQVVKGEILTATSGVKDLMETRHADEMGMALGERNEYKTKLQQIQELAGSTMNDVPDKKQEVDEQALRVKKYQL